MKKIIMSGLVLLISIAFTGCKKQELNVTFENYYYRDSKDEKNIEEYIEVSVDANEISESTIKQILEQAGSKSIGTHIMVNNLQGVQIAKLDEINDKVSVDIEDDYETKKKCDIVLKEVDVFREKAESERDSIVESGMKGITEIMVGYRNFSNTFNDLEDKTYLEELIKTFPKSGTVNIDMFTNKSKEIKDNEKFTTAIEILDRATTAYNNATLYSKDYQKNKSEEILKSFKSEVLEFRRHVATYEIQVESLPLDIQVRYKN